MLGLLPFLFIVTALGPAAGPGLQEELSERLQRECCMGFTEEEIEM